MVFNYTLILLCFFGISILNAQNLSSEELIEKWERNDVYQTIEAEKTFTDLKNNYDSLKYHQVVSEIKEYLEEEPNLRLEVRLKMYEILNSIRLAQKVTPEIEDQISQLFEKAIFIKDEQILSEIYSIYIENGKASFEDNLFYITKTVEIQERIGTQYFPKYYLRLFFAGLIYYNLSMYNESIYYSKKSLKILGPAENNLSSYVWNHDLLGASYYHLNKIDSGMYHYQKIYDQLRDYNLNFPDYKEGFSNYDSPYFNIWLGISQGGIAKGLVLQKKYEEAIPYLEYNLKQSQIYNQPNDVAKVQNLLAEVYQNQNQAEKAFQFRWAALKNAKIRNTLRESIIAAKGLENLYKQKSKFDSAYFYNELGHSFETELFKSINHTKFLSVTNRLQHEKMQNAISEAEKHITEQRLARNLILIFSFAILGFVLIFYQRFRNQQKNKIENLNHKKDLAEKNLQESQEIIKEAHEQLQLFRKRLKQNNKLIETLKTETEKETPNYSELQASTILTKDDWIHFRKQFDKVYPNYLYSLREAFPQLSQAEIRYLCLVKLNLRQIEIAAALGISDSSIRVTWHRMRKKLDIECSINPEEFLSEFEKNYQLN